MVTLHWECLTPRHWRLVDQDGNGWATVRPYIDPATGEPAKGGGRGMFAKPTCRVTFCTSRGSSWVLAATIGQAKRRAEQYVQRRNSEDFTIVAESPEPAFMPTLAGLRAIGAV